MLVTPHDLSDLNGLCYYSEFSALGPNASSNLNGLYQPTICINKTLDLNLHNVHQKPQKPKTGKLTKNLRNDHEYLFSARTVLVLELVPFVIFGTKVLTSKLACICISLERNHCDRGVARSLTTDSIAVAELSPSLSVCWYMT